MFSIPLTQKGQVKPLTNFSTLVVLILVTVSMAGCAIPGFPVTGKSSDAPDAPYDQSETSSAIASYERQTIVVTYNDGTDTDKTILYTPNTRKILKGASLMGWSYSQDQGKTWTYGGKVPPPEGWSVLWGDPAMTRSNRSARYVFMSNLAIPDSKMPADGIEGYVIKVGADSYIGGACIARSSDGGKTFAAYQCVSNTVKNEVTDSEKGHFYDGGSMASSSAGEIYAAFYDVTTGQIDVYRSPDENGQFVLLPSPFPNLDIATHPRIRVNFRFDDALYVAAQTSSGTIYINRYLNGQWGSPVVAGMHGSRYPYIDFGNGVGVRTGPQFSFAIGPASDEKGTDAIRFLYTRQDDKTGRYYVTGSFCPLSLSSTSCWDAPEWGTPPGFASDVFNPNVEAWIGYLTYFPAWKATYYLKDDSRANTIWLRQGNLEYRRDGTRDFMPYVLTRSMSVCPDLRGYWGDYDDLIVVGTEEGSNAPRFMRTMSDSSLGCDKRWEYTSHHVHVRSIFFK